MTVAKGTVEPGAALSNSYRLDLPVLGEIFFTEIGELDQQLKTVVLADQTVQTTGKTEPVQTDTQQYMHHVSERIACEAWFQACIYAAPGHKQIGTIHYMRADNTIAASYVLIGCMFVGRKLPALKAADDGQGLTLTWKLSVDDILPL